MIPVSQIEELTLECLIFYTLSSWHKAIMKNTCKNSESLDKKQRFPSKYNAFNILHQKKKKSKQFHPPEVYYLQFLLFGKKC